MKKILAFFLLVGFAFLAQAAQAATVICPSNVLVGGIMCSSSFNQYACKSATICATAGGAFCNSGVTTVGANIATYDDCGAALTCNGGSSICYSSYPYTCTTNTVISNCAAYSCGTCSSCNSGFALSGGACVAVSSLKFTFPDSYSSSAILQSFSPTTSISMFLDGSGNLGLGTSTPGYKLDVYGPAGLDSHKFTTDGNGNATFESFYDRSNVLYFLDPSAATTSLNVNSNIYSANGILGTYGTSSSNFMMGNLGVGTASPTQKLDVRGSIILNTNGQSALISTYYGASTNGNNIFVGGGGQGSVYDGTNAYTGSENVSFGISALSSNTTGYRNSAIGMYALNSNTSGYYNVAVGPYALRLNTSGYNNIADGYEALYSNTTGYSNIANGAYALSGNISGAYNIANGYTALQNNTSGSYNIAYGLQALISNTTGTENTAAGHNALLSNTTGSQNIALGYYAGYNGSVALQTMSNSTFLGASANSSVNGVTNSMALGNGAQVNASNQVVIGNNSITQTLLNGNVGIGTTSPAEKLDVNGAVYLEPMTAPSPTTNRLYNVGGNVFWNGIQLGAGGGGTNYWGQSGSNLYASSSTWNLVVGTTTSALSAVLTIANSNTSNPFVAFMDSSNIEQGRISFFGNNSTFVGGVSGKYFNGGSGIWNTGLGYGALQGQSGANGSYNTAVGGGALGNLTQGHDNSAFGLNALMSNISGNYNDAFGSGALYTDNTGGFNQAFGYQSLYKNTSGNNNSAFGYQALYKNTTGAQNVAAGYQSLYNNTTGTSSVAIGYYALYGNNTGNNNIGIGQQVLLSNTSGTNNIALGYQSMISNSTGGANIGIGYQSLYSNLASNNVAVGPSALANDMTGNSSVAIGAGALEYVANGTVGSNTGIGWFAASSVTGGSNNIFIGPYAANNLGQATLNKTLAIGTTDNGHSLILGSFGAGTLGTNGSDGQVGINTNSLYNGMALTVGGAIYATDFIYTPSDRRLKHNIQDLSESDYQKILKLRPVSFTYNSNGKNGYGFIAQELENYFPDVVNTNKADGMKSVTYENLIAPTIMAVQEQQKKIDQQETMINILLDRVNKLEKKSD